MERIDRIEALLLDDPHAVIEPIIRAEFKISERVFQRDLKEAWHRIRARAEADRSKLFARAQAKWERRERMADERGDLKAGNVALDRWTKLNGLYPAAELKVSGSVAVHATLDVTLDGIIAVLDPAGLAALDVVLAQIEAARAAGRLPETPALGGGEVAPGEDGMPPGSAVQ